MHKQRNDLASLGIIVLACLPLVVLLWAACAVSIDCPSPARGLSFNGTVQSTDLHVGIQIK